MNSPTDLGRELDRAIPHLTGVPAEAFLQSGRSARRRRRVRAAIAGAAGVAIIGGAGWATIGGTAPDDRASASASPEADPIPDWAEEYGNHGPVSIAPDGELWVAPDARLIRSVELPTGPFASSDVVSAYAAVAEMDGKVRWAFVYRVADGVLGELDDPGRWTNDFEVWIEDVSSQPQRRQSFAESLVRFADDRSERLVPGQGVEIVAQADEVAYPNRPNHPRRAAAQVTSEGRTWFVLAEGPKSSRAFYSAYEPAVVGASDLQGFLDYLARGARA